MRGRALVVFGSALVVLGLFVVSPAVWLLFDRLFQQIFGAPLIGIIIGGGGLIVPLVLTAVGTASTIGGTWMIANGNRRRREHLKPPAAVPHPVDTTSIGQ